MAENVNKTSAEKIRNADDVVTGMRVQGSAVAGAAAAAIFEGKPERKLGVAELVELLATKLEGANDRFRQADATHQAETSGDVDARETRDGAIASLRASVISSAHAITGAFGASVCASMGLDVTWQARGDLLVGQARNAVQLIRRGRKLKPLAAGVKVDTGELADAIEAACNEVDEALEAVKREERAAQQTFQERELVSREWERVYPGIAELFTGLCILAGRDELAARVKPTVRKMRSRGKDATQPTEATPNGAAANGGSNGTTPAPNGDGHTEDVVTH
ncbi:MAG TPA: hypothetical protein VL400_21845 [Polyangiaceae bacterium]|jgi:hypothetical protein|nr:hypothetical protein [Polyangiaceae bacterium]